MDYYEKRDWYPELEGLKAVIDVSKSQIRSYYRGANIFITGGAGFLGSLLIEKISRSCPDFGNIYLLLRAKRGLTPTERLEQLFDDQIFDNLKKENPGFVERIVLMEGDLAEPMCGLSEENISIIKNEVNYIYHIAACLRMAEPMLTAYKMNVRATKDLLDLGTQMKQLKGFVYVSTAYSNCFRPEIGETFYEPTYNCTHLENLLEVASANQLAYLTPKLVGPWVNTYALTKAVAEDMVKLYVGKIPVAITRPSIVIGCAGEPLTNWINNVYGVTGVTAGACTGIMRVWYADRDKIADIIPADYVVNTMIAVSWQIAKYFEEKCHHESPIYNIVSSPKAPTTWGEYMDLSSRNAKKSKIATCKSIGEYAFMLIRRRWLFFALFYTLHLGQGIIVDTMLVMKKKPPMLLKGYLKIMRFNLQLAFFSEREWKYEQYNVDRLLEEMTVDDKKLFPFDMANFDWHEYHITTIRGVMRYIVKSKDLENPRKAQLRYLRFMRVRKFVMYSTKVLLFYSFIGYLGRLSEYTTNLLSQ